jgi:hypothetical protein
MLTTTRADVAKFLQIMTCPLRCGARKLMRYSHSKNGETLKRSGCGSGLPFDFMNRCHYITLLDHRELTGREATTGTNWVLFFLFFEKTCGTASSVEDANDRHGSRCSVECHRDTPLKTDHA